MSDVFVGPATGKLVTTIYVPAKPSPHGRFVVAQAFAVDHWKQTALQPPERSDWIVAVLDLGMPGKDGFQVAAEIRASPALRHLPLIAVTGYGQERDLHASRQAGFDAHLVKPVSPQALEAVIQKQFERSTAQPGRGGRGGRSAAA